MQLVPVPEDQPRMRCTAAAFSTVPADFLSCHLLSTVAGEDFALPVPRRDDSTLVSYNEVNKNEEKAALEKKNRKWIDFFKFRIQHR